MATAKQPPVFPKVGDIMRHKVDNRKLVVIGFTYERDAKVSPIIGKPTEKEIAAINKELTRAEKEKKVIGITCRFLDTDQSYISGTFIPEEIAPIVTGTVTTSGTTIRLTPYPNG